jgi:hypothetical protein
MSGQSVEGVPPKRFRIYRCDIDGKPFGLEGEYDSVAQVRAHRFRLDRTYLIEVNRRFYTREAFEDTIANGDIG